MARAKDSGNGRLQDAVMNLIQTQAAFLARASETDRILAENERSNAETFKRIDARLAEHSRILGEHSRVLAELYRMLEALPDTLREKIGFRVPATPQSGQ